MDNPLEALFGNRTAWRVMLYLFHYGEGYATGIAKDFGSALSPVQRQLDKFEIAGVLVSRMVGKTRVYSFNARHPLTEKLKEVIRVIYEAMSAEERRTLFAARRRSRRRGKPVIDKA